jgi:hypothetical protein
MFIKLLFNAFSFVSFFLLTVAIFGFLDLLPDSRHYYKYFGLFIGLIALVISSKYIHDFDKGLMRGAIGWLIGLILGGTYILIFDSGNAQGIFLPVFITGPIGWIVGMVQSIVAEREQSALNA